MGGNSVIGGFEFHFEKNILEIGGHDALAGPYEHYM
jgi:hypothetical protein